MSHLTASFSKHRHLPRRKSQRGVALVTTLLLLLLLTGISITMVLSVSSDVLVDGYYRNFRGSFYAADSGINIARAAIVADLQSKVVPGWGATLAPFPAGTDGVVQNDVYNTYKTTTSLNTGSAAMSWPGKFQLANPTTVSLSAAGCQVQNGTGTCAAPVWTKGAATTGYKYIYNYSLAAIGQAKGTEAASITESGSITMNATIAPGVPAVVNFAAYGMFIDQYPLCGNDLVAGTITGPVFTNGSWNFGTGGYTFTDVVQSAGAQAGYDNGGCVPSAAASANGISPNFQKGFQPSQNKITPPANSFNQEQAVLDGVGLSATQPNNAALHTTLKDASGAAYPSGGASSGVFLPYTVSGSPAVKTFTGGGILVEGNATVTLSVPNPASNSTAQIYTIVQGANVTTITVDPAANGGVGSTSISNLLGAQTISGVPTMKDAAGNNQGPGTMLYVDGDITALSGPGEGKTAIQNASALTITSSGDVTLTGDIKYASEPVTFAKNQIPGTDVDTLIPGNDTRQVLGIFTASGNVNLNNLQSDGNLEIDASIATISAGGSGGIINKGGNTGGTLNIVGGRIQNTIQNIGFSKRNVFFDRRFLAGGFAPPWFPSAVVTPPVGALSLNVTPTIQRTQWLNRTAYQ